MPSGQQLDRSHSGRPSDQLGIGSADRTNNGDFQSPESFGSFGGVVTTSSGGGMSFGFLLLGAVDCFRASVPTYLDGLLDRATHDRINGRIDAWSATLLRRAAIHLLAEGLEHAEGNEPFVVMSNHQSLFDIPIMFQAVPHPMRMIAKRELFRIPLFGTAMRVAGIIGIDRQNRRRAVEAIEHAKSLVQSGLSIWIAPEGTRSRTGELGEFKRGGFHLALGTGARILPATIVGTRDVLPPGTLSLARGLTVRVRFSHPVSPAHFGRTQLDQLVTAVRDQIGSRL